MPRFMVNLDTRDLDKQLEEFLDGVLHIMLHSLQMFSLSEKEAGKICIHLLTQFHDDVVEGYRKIGGERAEKAYSEYYYAKALAFAMAGKAGQGRGFYDTARGVRGGGKFAELCEPHYRGRR